MVEDTEDTIEEEENGCPLGICDGSGYVAAMEEVSPGEPQTMALVGERRCECNLPEDDEYEPDYDEEE